MRWSRRTPTPRVSAAMLGPGETCITAIIGNFKGRMGDPGARIHPASPATVAASAIAGHIATASNRPGWVDQVRAGDIIVGGLNYGMESSRPAARSLRNLGIAALFAVDQQTLLPQRCEFWAPRPRIPGAMWHFRKGKPPRCRSRTSLKARRVPSMLLDLMTHGLYSHLERQGLIEPSAAGG